MRIVFLVIVLLATLNLRAGEAIGPFVTASKSGASFFKMVPPMADKPAGGTAYSIQADGTFKELWSIHGWFDRQLFLSDDGHTLVRLIPAQKGSKPSRADLALAFYHDGELVKECSTVDMVKQPDAVKVSGDGYAWLAPVWVTVTDSRRADGTSRVERDFNAEPQLDSAGIFRVKTIDGITYHIEASTGKLVKRVLPTK